MKLAGRMPPIWALAAVAAVASVPVLMRDQYYLGLLITTGIYCIALLGLDLIKGYTGVLSLGQAGFMGLAAYVSAILTTRFLWSPLPAFIAALLVVVLAATCMALPGSRLTGFNLALATLGFAVIVEGLALVLRDWTGGAMGVSGVPELGLPGMPSASMPAKFWLVWGVCGALFWLARNLVLSPVGYTLRAVKQDQLAAATLGVDPFRVKFIIFLIGAAYSAVAGSLYVHFNQFIAPEMVSWDVSVGLVTMLVLGGEGSLLGVFLGAFLLQVLPEAFNGVRDYLLIIQGGVLVVLMVYLPRGLIGLARTASERALKRWRREDRGSRHDVAGGS